MVKKAYNFIKENKIVTISILVLLPIINNILLKDKETSSIIGIILLIINTIFITRKNYEE